MESYLFPSKDMNYWCIGGLYDVKEGICFVQSRHIMRYSNNIKKKSFFLKGNFGDTKEPWQSKWEKSILVQYHPIQCAILKVETQMSSTSGWYKSVGNSTKWEPGVPVYKHETEDVYIYRSRGGDWKIGEKQDLRVYSSKDSAFLRGISYIAI